MKGYYFDRKAIITTIKGQILERFQECQDKVEETLNSGGGYKVLGGTGTVTVERSGRRPPVAVRSRAARSTAEAAGSVCVYWGV